MARVPPKMPATVPDLDRLISLLGNRGNGQDFTPALQELVVEQLGDYPSPEMAKSWKRALRARRQELLDATDEDLERGLIPYPLEGQPPPKFVPVYAGGYDPEAPYLPEPAYGRAIVRALLDEISEALKPRYSDSFTDDAEHLEHVREVLARLQKRYS